MKFFSLPTIATFLFYLVLLVVYDDWNPYTAVSKILKDSRRMHQAYHQLLQSILTAGSKV